MEKLVKSVEAGACEILSEMSDREYLERWYDALA